MDMGNVPGSRRDQVGSSKEAQNIGAEKLLELDFFFKCRKDRDLRTANLFIFCTLDESESW